MALLENVNKGRKGSNDGKQRKDERVTRAKDQGVVNHLALNSALMEFCREMEAAAVIVINT